MHTQRHIIPDWRLMHVTQTHTETGMHSPVHVELSRSKEYPAVHPHSKEPTVLEQVWEQLFPPGSHSSISANRQ